MSRASLALIAACTLMLPVPSLAASTPAQKCEAAIENAAGSFFQCRLKAEAAFTLKGDAAKRDAAFVKCVDALAKKFDKVLMNTKVGPACPATEPVSAFAGVLIQRASSVSSAAAGATFPACGDGLVNAVGEHCDASDLGGATCASLGFASGTLGCTPGCKFDTSACVSGGGATLKQVVFDLAASTSLQGLHLSVSYPTTKGGFTGSGENVACFTNLNGSFAKNDQGNGTLMLAVANPLPLTLPDSITCGLDVTAGVLTAADLTVTVEEVTADGSAGDPTALAVTVSVP